MVMAVGIFLTASVPDTVETNEQGDAILPADLFPDKFGKKGGKTTSQTKRDFFIKTYNYFLFFDRDQRDENGRPAFVPNDLKTQQLTKH